MADGEETAEYDITLDLNLYARCLIRSHNEPLQSEPRELKAYEKNYRYFQIKQDVIL